MVRIFSLIICIGLVAVTIGLFVFAQNLMSQNLQGSGLFIVGAWALGAIAGLFAFFALIIALFGTHTPQASYAKGQSKYRLGSFEELRRDNFHYETGNDAQDYLENFPSRESGKKNRHKKRRRQPRSKMYYVKEILEEIFDFFD